MQTSLKKALSLLLTIALLLSFTACSTQEGGKNTSKPASQGLRFEKNNDGKSYYVSGIGTCTDTDVVIPSVYEDLPVTSIGNSAFQGYTGLTSITIPDSVTSIGFNAFSGCSSLTNITIPDSVTTIAPYAFEYTAYYDDEANWKNDVLYIGDRLIEAKDSLSGAYKIKKGTKRIETCAFNNCSSLTSITIPDSVTSISEYAFAGCSSLTSIKIGNDVTSIGTYAFENTAYYNDEANWTNDVLYIGNHLIKAKDSLSGAYTIKEGTKCIADSAFNNCSSLTSITIPDSVTSIGRSTFNSCTSLTGITIGNGVTSIGEYAFIACSSLTDISFEGTMKQWQEIRKGEDWNYEIGDHTIHCSDGDISK